MKFKILKLELNLFDSRYARKNFIRTEVNDADYTVLSTDTFIAYTNVTDVRVVSLPSCASLTDGTQLIIKDESGLIDGGAVNVEYVADGTDTIDGAPSGNLASAYGVVRLYTNGSDWFSW